MFASEVSVKGTLEFASQEMKTQKKGSKDFKNICKGLFWDLLLVSSFLLSLYFYMYSYLYLYLDLKNLTATALQGKARCTRLLVFIFEVVFVFALVFVFVRI